MTETDHSKRPALQFAPGTWWAPAGWLIFIAFPLVIAVLREVPAGEISAVLHAFTMTDLPPDIVEQAIYVMAIPLGSLLVVFVRLTLGLRPLGPFRPILIALALQMTGIVAGLAFLAATFVLVVLIRPLILRQQLAFFARTALLVSVVANFAVLTVLAGKWFAFDDLISVIHFPLIVLCLVSVSFATKIETEGLKSAVWRAGVTVATAIAITLIVTAPGVAPFLLSHPEVLVLQIGLIVLVGRYGAVRLLDKLNPSTLRPQRKSNRRQRRRKSAARGRSQEIHPVRNS